MSKDGQGVAAEGAGDTTFQVSVLRRKLTGQVLFLEAGKDFVDQLLSFLLLPVGTVIHILSEERVHMKPWGGVSRLFESVQKLDSSFLLVDKRTLVGPPPADLGIFRSTGLLQGFREAANTPTPSKKFKLPDFYYRCNSIIKCVSLSTKEGTPCEKHVKCLHSVRMSVLPRDVQELAAALVGHAASIKEATGSCSTSPGFVKECITFMITDSLEILPATTTGSINLLNKLKVTALAALESSDITVTSTQVLRLLQSALTSTDCLNDVFGDKTTASQASPSATRVVEGKRAAFFHP